MGKIILLGLLAHAEVPPSMSPTYVEQNIYRQYTKDEMTNITIEAITHRDDAKLLMHNFEQWVNHTCTRAGIPQEFLVPAGTVGATIISHKLTTRGLHMYYSPIKNLTVRPDVDYYFTGGWSTNLTANWRF